MESGYSEMIFASWFLSKVAKRELFFDCGYIVLPIKRVFLRYSLELVQRSTHVSLAVITLNFRGYLCKYNGDEQRK